MWTEIHDIWLKFFQSFFSSLYEVREGGSVDVGTKKWREDDVGGGVASKLCGKGGRMSTQQDTRTGKPLYKPAN
jgi:hypothetical protein